MSSYMGMVIDTISSAFLDASRRHARNDVGMYV